MTPWAMPEGIGSAVGWRYPSHSSAGGAVDVSRSSHADIHTFQEKREVICNLNHDDVVSAPSFGADAVRGTCGEIFREPIQ